MSSLYKQYRQLVNEGLSRVADTPVITEQHIQHLPGVVQKYLRYTGALGKPTVQNVRAVFEGKIRNGLNSPWMDFKSEQYNFFDSPTRLFYMKARMFSIPFCGLHAYVGNEATMRVKMLSFIPLVNAQGPKMNQSETVTMFNDMCFLAPASLIGNNILWTEISEDKVTASFTNAGKTIRAKLFFNNEGALVNFVSGDRYLSADGKNYVSYDWETPLSSYQYYNSSLVPSYGEAIWKMPNADFCYGQFNLKELEYNCRH